MIPTDAVAFRPAIARHRAGHARVGDHERVIGGDGDDGVFFARADDDVAEIAECSRAVNP